MWGQIAGAALGAATNYFGNKGSSHANDPMTPDQLYLGSAEQGIHDVMRDVDQLTPMQYYQGSTVAGMNPYLSGALGQMNGWGSGMGGNMMNQSYNAGQQSLQAFGNGMDLMGNLSNAPGGPFRYNQGVFNQTMGNLMPAMQGSYDAATRDNNRNLNWQQLPGLNMGAAGAGQQGGTKLGQQSALAQGMTADRNADIGASMYQNAVNTANQNAMTSGQQNLNAQMGMVDAYGSYGTAGGDLMNQAYNMGTGNMQQGLNAGQIQQGYDQSVLGDDVARWNFNQQQPYDFLGNRMDIYNMGKAGGYSPRGPQGLNTFEAISNGAMMGAGIYGAGQDAGWWGKPTQPQLQGGGGWQPTSMENARDTMFNW